MGSNITTATYTCDWTDEAGDVCGEAGEFTGTKHLDAARDAGWGWYTNAYVRRDRWTEGAKLLFCPVHATVFRNNHGWGDLEDYGPPTKWWESFFKPKKS